MVDLGADDATLPGDVQDTLAAGGEVTRVPGGAGMHSGASGDADRYELGEVFARGGIGRIRKAFDRRLGRVVAMKELLGGSVHERAVLRFSHEATITARLQHPAIVPVHDIGRHADGSPYMCMKLVEGRSLDQLIDETETPAARLALLPHVIDVAEAIAYAHGQGVIHRDLKPANVLVGAFGETVVIDWGLAKDLSARRAEDGSEASPGVFDPKAPSELTQPGQIVGTLAYMPPEQAAGEVVDARSDVYSIGALLYHLLTGHHPYEAESAGELLGKLLDENRAPPDVREEVADVPPDLADIVRKAMARDPGARYPDAAGLAEDLQRFQTGQLVGAHRYSLRQLLGRWARRHAAALAVGGVALTTIAVLGTLSVREIAQGRETAERQRAGAVEARAQAESARSQATARLHEVMLVQARDALEVDPTETVEWLAQLPPEAEAWQGEARWMFADARHRGVARYVLSGHRDPINGVAASPTEDLIASTAGDGLFLRRADGRVVWREPVPAQYPMFSADGRWLAFQSSMSGLFLLDQSRPRVWDCRQQREVELDGATEARIHHNLRFDPGVARAVAMQNTGLSVWSLPSGDRVDHALPKSKFKRGVVAFVPDSSDVFVSGFAGEMLRVDLDSGAFEPIGFEIPPSHPIAVDPTGRHLATWSDDVLYFVDLETGKMESVRRPRLSHNHAVAPDGSHVAVLHDGRLQLWGVAPDGAGEHVRWRSHPLGGDIGDVAFSPDGAQVVVGGDAVRTWTIDRRSVRWVTQSAATRPVFGHDGHRVVAATGGEVPSVHVWTARRDGVALHELDPPPDVHQEPRPLVALDVDRGRGYWGGTTRVRRSAKGSFEPSTDGVVVVRDTTTGATEHLDSGEARLDALALDPDGGLVVLGGSGALRRWADPAREGAEPVVVAEGIRRISAPSGGTFVAVLEDGSIVHMNFLGKKLAQLAGPGAAATHAIAVDEGRVFAWRREDGTIAGGRAEAITELADVDGDEVALAASERGERIAVSRGPDEITVFEVDGGETRTFVGNSEFAGFEPTIGNRPELALSADGRFAVLGSHRPFLSVWDLENDGDYFEIASPGRQAVGGPWFARDGRTVVADVTPGPTVYAAVWDLNARHARPLESPIPSGNSGSVGRPWLFEVIDGRLWTLDAYGRIDVARFELPETPKALREAVESATSMDVAPMNLPPAD